MENWRKLSHNYHQTSPLLTFDAYPQHMLSGGMRKLFISIPSLTLKMLSKIVADDILHYFSEKIRPDIGFSLTPIFLVVGMPIIQRNLAKLHSGTHWHRCVCACHIFGCGKGFREYLHNLYHSLGKFSRHQIDFFLFFPENRI